MVNWYESPQGRGTWRFYHLNSTAGRAPRLVSYMPITADRLASSLAIGWSAQVQLVTLARLTATLIAPLSRHYPSAQWALMLTGYGAECVTHELVGQPNPIGIEKWEKRTSELPKTEEPSSAAQDLNSAFSTLAAEVGSHDDLAVRADASAGIEGFRGLPIQISVWGRPNLHEDAILSMPYGSLSIRAMSSIISELRTPIAEAISTTIIGGGDLVDISDAVRVAVDIPPTGAKAA
jgi:hypothetical protein